MQQNAMVEGAAVASPSLTEETCQLSSLVEQFNVGEGSSHSRFNQTVGQNSISLGPVERAGNRLFPEAI